MAQTSILAGGAPTPNMGATSPGGGGSASTLQLTAGAVPLTPSHLGQAVIIDAPGDESTWAKGKADSANTATVRGIVIGLVDDHTFFATKATAQFAGIVKLSVAHWNVVTGDPTGLVPGDSYYLSPTVSGGITSSKPVASGQLVVPLGQAISPTELLLAIGAPVLIP